MAKKAPDHIDGLDDSSLDEYGVWVKSAAEEPVSEADELVPELLDDVRTNESDIAPLKAGERFVEIAENGRGPETGEIPVDGSIQKEQEVPEMSENDKANAASPSDELDIEKDLSLDSSEDIVIPGDDDLSGLSDLLMNIDEEQDTEDTIYLEDDDLSLDLDTSEDLELDSDVVLGGADEGYDEDITIPGLDDLDIEGDDTGLEGFAESLSQLDEDQLDLSVDTPEEPKPSPTPLTGSEFEMHYIEEVGLDEFLEDESGPLPASETDVELSEEIVLEETPFDDEGSGVDELRTSDLDLDEEIVLEDMVANDDEAFGAEIQLDLDEDVSFDTGSFTPETGIEETMPGAAEEEMVAVSNISPVIEEPNLPDLEKEEIGSEFDDIAAVTEEFSASTSESQPGSSTVSLGNGESAVVLKSIEDELHAIRSELTDLRSELKKLREKGISRETTAAVSAVVDRTDALVDNLQDSAEQAVVKSTASEGVPVAGRGFFDDDEDETIALTGDELDNILNSAEFTEEAGEPSNPDMDELDEDTASESVPQETRAVFEDTARDESVSSFEDSVESEEFPPIEEIDLQEIENDEPFAESQLEIENPDLTTGGELTEESDLMDDSVVAAEIVDDPFSGSQQAIEQMAAMDIDNVLAGIEELKDSEEDIELFTGDEIDSMELELPEELAENESHAVEDRPQQTPNPVKEDLSSGLKQEIKAVLAYMDQLLESLPEEKIEEFARSEHFEVYKKLFNELGL